MTWKTSIPDFGEAGELVGEPDVDVAVGRLSELCHLGCLGGPEVPDAVAALKIGPLVEVEDRLVESLGRFAPSAVRPPTSLGYLRKSSNTRPVSTRSG